MVGAAVMWCREGGGVDLLDDCVSGFATPAAETLLQAQVRVCGPNPRVCEDGCLCGTLPALWSAPRVKLRASPACFWSCCTTGAAFREQVLLPPSEHIHSAMMALSDPRQLGDPSQLGMSAGAP